MTVPLTDAGAVLKASDNEELSRLPTQVRTAPRTPVYACAQWYDAAYPGYPGDRDYYLERGRRGAVLYLGVGTGRIFAELAALNPDAVGLDRSGAMVRWFQRQHPEVHPSRLMEADVLSAELPAAAFDAVLAPYSFLQVLDSNSVPAVLERVHGWLRPGGRFCTDTFSPYLIPFRAKGCETAQRIVEGQAHISIYIEYDHLQRRMTELAHVQTADADHVLEMHLHYYFPHELVAGLNGAGFHPVSVFGGYRGEGFDPTENEVLVYEARRPNAPAAATPGEGND